MIPIQPTLLGKYLGITTITLPQDVSHYFFMSWEDAVWQLLEHYHLPHGSKILVPTFYCGDVIENMQEHGLEVHTYPVDRSFQTQVDFFISCLRQTQPAIVVIFNAVGIRNQLLDEAEKWLPYISEDTLLIEDSVHSIVDPQEIIFLTNRHIVIDSLRKVVPLQGSNLYAKDLTLDIPKKYFSTLFYQWQVVLWWFLFQLCLVICMLSINKNWRKWWNMQAEKTMIAGYDVIGDSIEGATGWLFFNMLAHHLAIQRIKGIKKIQVELYESILTVLDSYPVFFNIHFNARDKGELRGYPVGLEIERADLILNRLRTKGLLTRFELNDSIWSTKQKVIYLPLGPHLSSDNIRWVAETVLQTASQVKY